MRFKFIAALFLLLVLSSNSIEFNRNFRLINNESQVQRKNDAFPRTAKVMPRISLPTELSNLNLTQNADACNKLRDNDKCVHGQCAFNEETRTTVCMCDPNYYGPKCEREKPCVSHKCRDKTCVELSVNNGMSEFRFPVCACKALQCSNSVCRNQNGLPKCKNDAYCYPCSLDKNSKIKVCNEEELSSGFRCICSQGFMPPLCDRKIGPCDFNLCKNNATCLPLSNLEYSCSC